MRTPMLDEAPSRPTSPVVVRHHRSRIVVVTGALTLLAVAAGAAVALVDRPTPARPAAVASPTTAAPVAVTPGPAVTPTTAGPVAAPKPGNAPGHVTVNTVSPAPRPVLADGTYPAFIRKVDVDRRTMVVDVIQVFEDQAAVEAAIQDGRSPGDAQYLSTYIRNQNPRLRTLPIARDATIKFLGTCEGPAAPRAVLSELAKRAASGGWYYALTVSDGSVWRIVEHQIQNAC